jgi:hypothetical protein
MLWTMTVMPAKPQARQFFAQAIMKARTIGAIGTLSGSGNRTNTNQANPMAA